MSLYNHDWSSITPDETLEIFETNILGLADEAVLSRREIHGMNTLPETSKDSYFFIFLRQFTSPLLYILVGAAIIAVLLGEITDGIIIGAVLLLNGFMGAFQEGKAQDALFALKKLTDFQTLVVRNGVHDLISSTLLVPGDVIILREGDKVPADGRILESKDFSTSEALLTGESFPVSKNNTTLPLNEERMITDQVNMVLSGTTVAKGTAHVVVVATGIETELGKISQNIKENTTEIPLQVQVRNLARIIIVVVVLAIGFLFGAGILLGNDVSYMFLVALSLMVSVIPEGLPVVMTLILARGVKRMSEHNALVKRLQAVEALGQATIIAVDKTGTLTKNELSVVQCFIDDTLYNVSGTGYNPQGTITGPEGSQDRDHRRALDYITMISALASDAKIFYQDDAVTYVGDPTEIALIVFGKKNNYDREKGISGIDHIVHTPFDFEKKYLMTTFSDQGTERTLMIGAPEVILDMSALVWKRDGAAPLDPAERRVLDEHMHLFSTQGLRVIGLAESSEDGVTFVGFVAMQDALRPEVPLAVQKAKDAGMRVVMITGDHAITAEAIARQAGIFVDGDKVLTGHDMTHMSDEILQERVVGVTVFARVAPQHKMRIIKAFKARGEIIAMTGDGVNDVPSLVAADLGVAMGIVGTEVAKDAADIVLLDDDFGNISRAVEEGRHIYATLKKTLVYLFSTNLAELLVIMFGVLVIMRIPLIPAQIIWLNLVTDSFLVMTLAFLPRMTQDLNKDAHKKHPRYILDMPTFLRMVFFALIITGGTLAVFIAYLGQGIEVARTMVFVTLALFQIFRLLTIQSDTTSVFTVNPFAHRLTFFAVLGALALQSFAVYTPFMQKIFETVPLSFYEWLIALAVASSIIFFEEVRKFFVRRSEA